MLKVLRDRHFALLATCILTPLVLVALSVSNHLGCSVFDWLNNPVVTQAYLPTFKLSQQDDILTSNGVLGFVCQGRKSTYEEYE